jgi:hypothetical protein
VLFRSRWAEAQKLKSHAKSAFKRAVALDPAHEGANLALGLVKYQNRWLTPEERDRQAAADLEAEKLAQGLVKYDGRWVTREEQEKLAQGLVLLDGKWVQREVALRAQGLEVFEGRWLPRAEALARADLSDAERVAGVKLESVWTADFFVAGPWPQAFLTRISEALVRGRGVFDASFAAEGGLALLGGRMAEFYCFARDDRPYVDSVAHFGSLSPSLPSGWAEATTRAHGFYWFVPYALSSARVGYREDGELVGHSLHHWGHLLVNRDGQDGKLLPPWYDEALACWLEFRVLGSNVVACRGKREPREAETTTASQLASAGLFDWTSFRRGAWRASLAGALERNAVPSLEKLTVAEFSDLGLVELATGMAILEWIDSHGAGALGKFHAALRKGQPRPPDRVEKDARKRMALYDTAFRAATGESLVAANAAWKEWFRAHR